MIPPPLYSPQANQLIGYHRSALRADTEVGG